MSRDKPPYVRFELRLDPDLSDRLEEWLSEHGGGRTKAEITRELYEKHLNEDDLDQIRISPEQYGIIDDYRRPQSPIPSRQRLFNNWIRYLKAKL